MAYWFFLRSLSEFSLVNRFVCCCQILITPRRSPARRQTMLTPQIQKKQFLIWSLIPTSARPIPRKIASTIGLINVAQLRQTTITMAICAGSTPKSPAISIRTSINPKKKESVSNISVSSTARIPMISDRKRPMDIGTNPSSTVAILFMIPIFSITPRNTPAQKIVEDIMIAEPA